MTGPRPKTGIVHLGLGAFFRAFGCVYVADAMAASGGAWGITGVSLRNPDTRDALAGQGWAYTAVALGADKTETRRIEVLNDVLVAPENAQAVLDAMTDPAVKIVTLTVTEKGYCHTPARGRLNLDHPEIQHDLNHALPVTAIGFLLRALQMRHRAGTPPFTALSCDNLPDNGTLLRTVVLDMARQIDPILADWIMTQGRFPSTMVDRITPATTPADIAKNAQLTGWADAAPVMHEPFAQWVIEDDFVQNQRPDFSAAGAEMVKDVAPHEQMKLRMLNGTHSALAYTGYLAGYETISETLADPLLADYLTRLWQEIMPAVQAPEGVHLPDYATALRARYANPSIRHRTWQIAMDGSQKLPQRILGTLGENLTAGRRAPGLILAVAAWMRYVSGMDENGQPIDVRDPMADRLQALCAGQSTPEGTVKALLQVTEIFPPTLAEQLQTPLIETASILWRDGARGALRQVV